MKNILIKSIAFFMVALAFGQDTPNIPPTDTDALAKQLQNPIASLISVPFQGKF